MTTFEKAVAELHRQGLSMVGVRKGKVFIGAWNRDLENAIDIEVHPDQVKELAEDYEEHQYQVDLALSNEKYENN